VLTERRTPDRPAFARNNTMHAKLGILADQPASNRNSSGHERTNPATGSRPQANGELFSKRYQTRCV